MSKRAALRLANYFRTIGHRVKIRKHISPAGAFYRLEFAPKTALRGGKRVLLHLHG
jgi:hypothetical protein